MSYELQFKKKALKEWNKLNPTIQAEFLKILERRLDNPRIPKHQLKGAFAGYLAVAVTPGMRWPGRLPGRSVVLTIAVSHLFLPCVQESPTRPPAGQYR